MFIPKLVCGVDRVQMVIEQTGMVIEMAHSNGHRYKVASDLFRCPACRISIALPAQAPIVEGWQAEYGQVNAAITAEFADDYRRMESGSEPESAR